MHNNFPSPFADFRAISLRQWTMEHRGCEKEDIVEKAQGREFRFIYCISCGEYYYLGEIEGGTKNE